MKQNRPRKKAVFFDCTGTLYDPRSDERAHLEAARELVTHFHLGVTPQSLLERFSSIADKFLTQRGSDEFLAGDDMLRSILPHFGAIFQVPKTHENFETCKSIIRKMHCVHSALMPGAADTLAGVQERGYHVGLISHVDTELLRELLDCLAIKDYFDSITSAEEAKVCRPDPGIFEFAVSKANTTPGQAYFVGDDAERDIKTAQSLGFTTVYYTPSSNSPEYPADFSIQGLPELLPILDREVGQ